jgi:antitoxin MazE
MMTKIQKWGNSQGLLLERDGLIVVAPARPVRGKRSLKELVSRIPKNYKTEETDWGESVGLEVW